MDNDPLRRNNDAVFHDKEYTGWALLIRSHSLARISSKLSGNMN